MTAVEHALEIRGLTKRFGGANAVDDLSLAVPHGSFYGLVGPNGAGKTTTLSMATGLLRPDAGTALVHGIDVWQRPLEAKRLIGNLADGVDLYDRLTGEQLITFAGLLFGLDRATLRRPGARTCCSCSISRTPPDASSRTTPPA